MLTHEEKIKQNRRKSHNYPEQSYFQARDNTRRVYFIIACAILQHATMISSLLILMIFDSHAFFSFLFHKKIARYSGARVSQFNLIDNNLYLCLRTTVWLLSNVIFLEFLILIAKCAL